MYPEFVPIYVMLVVVIVLLLAVIVLLIRLLMKNKGGKQELFASIPQPQESYYGQQYQQQAYQAPYQQQQQYPQSGSVVFCKRCATQFDASQPYCPQCGTRR